MRRALTTEELAALEAIAGGPVVPLGGGMEGEVLALDEARVAKVWSARPAVEVRRLQAFTSALASLGLPFAVPEVLDVLDVDGRAVSIERRLHGVPLDRALADGSIGVDRARGLVVDLLEGLSATGPVPEARALPVLGEARPLVGESSFSEALAALVSRRAGPVLAAAVERFEAKIEALVTLLPAQGSGVRAVLHGDLFPGNVLVGPDGRDPALLDWGFLSTEGDPAFDAATAAALFDMYGPRAAEHEAALLKAAERRLGHDRRTLLVHRAAYSAATATAYSADGSDGHFAWCVAALNRPDVTAALLG